MTIPLQDLLAILPELIVIGAACLILALDPVLEASKKEVLAWLTLGTLAICIGYTSSHMTGRVTAFSDLVIIDSYAAFWKLLLYIVTGLTVLLSLAYLKAERLNIGEYYGFILLALAGMMVMVSGADLLTIYLGTELMSLSLYVMAGLKRSENQSLEASAKYFVLGAFSSGILLYGISLLFGLAGSTRLPVIAEAIAAQGTGNPMLSLALVLLAVGFGFKLAAVPFHMWTPDVYQGAPTSVTAFMAVASKAASFGAFLRVFTEGLGGVSADWSVLFTIICLVTLALGNLVAIVQTNIKRMLAYSSIAHAGYALIGVIVAGKQGGEAASTGFATVLLYIAIYSFMTLGAFALVGMLRKQGQESDQIEDFAGLAKREPLAAFFMLMFLVSLAGIPPTAGFIGKFYIFMAAVHAGLAWLAVVAVIFAAVSAFYYLRVVMVMYMREADGAAETHSRLETSPALSFVLACALAGVVLLGLFPNGLWSLATQAAPLLK
ncbi:MAG: NADH-quinone oxidoreductase subunit N [Nitrospirae bacterium]|nr:NADH-quinone oxidoreductase subunit N [Nitrospirota bacterium]MCE7966087.1 NADH-quinone oxidoreductase subunit N [Nitrospira sp. NTP2]MCK6492864.1 NADH-quinone oxidoreductase subunit N [Nitrospira sp.]MEB2339116.1 NADH-quinone oxidoreductase subunit N [Nitrospirales bacterium]RIK57739.1 MAG: NADH-quinone oxidoreductase subunit L [Nitrospira sp.]